MLVRASKERFVDVTTIRYKSWKKIGLSKLNIVDEIIYKSIGKAPKTLINELLKSNGQFM